MTLPTRFECAGCGAAIDERHTPPFRCPAAVPGDDVDHVIARRLDTSRVLFPPPPALTPPANPFLTYRDLLHVHWLGRESGLSRSFVDDVVRGLDDAVAAIDGGGFRETPFGRSAPLSDALGFAAAGGVWVKDETGNVAGTHKARHLFGVQLWLEMAGRLRFGPPTGTPLAIASCGNAALAAAAVAKAARRSLEVFVPTWADKGIVERLRELGAKLTVCPRRDDETGDPCLHRFREAVAAGAIPFTCQGPENGLTIEGGHTLAWEMATALAREERALDRLFVPVGGGALASACIAGLQEARDLGAIPKPPRIHPVQTEGCAPLSRAWERLLARRDPPAADDLEYAARHRSGFMEPWGTEPKSLADAILDDETYDWLAVVRGMIETGGAPVVVSEDLIREANELAQDASPNAVSYTGSAALAGLLHLHRAGEIGSGESVAVLLTGVRR